MKFAKFVILGGYSMRRELDQELVPEWRSKYLDYKAGKKKIKAVARAQQKANKSPPYPSLRRATADFGHPSTTPKSAQRASSLYRNGAEKRQEAGDGLQGTAGNPPSLSRSTPGPRDERQPLRTPGSRLSSNIGGYGSIISSPHQHVGQGSDLASLKLPDPALDPQGESNTQLARERSNLGPGPKTPSPVLTRQETYTSRPSLASIPDGKGSSVRGPGSLLDLKGNTVPGPSMSKKLLQRVFTSTGADDATSNVPLEQLSEVERRQDEFFAFLDSELAKIDGFYQMKEKEAASRLQTLRQQLHIMRDRRLEDVLAAKRKETGNGTSDHPNVFINPFSILGIKDTIAGRNRVGKSSKALAQMATPAGPQPRDAQVVNRRDFARRPDPQGPEVSYRSAKRKLKYALQEFYRGLELLKAYAYLNRTAFRKINKKYDKAVNARPTMRYMSEKVNKAWFVQSEVVDSLIVVVEDLYSRYFERGNRKIAVSKLRRVTKKSGDYSSNTFLSGLLVTAGTLFAIQALVYASQHLHSPDSTIATQTGYLLQLWTGVNFQSRKWWAYSNWRLLLAGLYPVEFRDFFLGDMYCSQVYAMGNIELFFCLYSRHWGNPEQCNSSHSRLLGFFTTIPSILRAFQCLRRYADTRNSFPHLLNFGKYMFGVLYYVNLSLYRIDKSDKLQATFITFALLNAVYTSIWDLAMDWSLCNPYAKNRLLRDTLAFRNTWVYYAAMILDVVVRNNWLFYAAFANDIQHSAILSFFVSLSEVLRRGVWTIFRVENEHCTNVQLVRASRDVPLPYDVSSPELVSTAEATTTPAPQDLPPQGQQMPTTPYMVSADMEQGTPLTTARPRRPSVVAGISRVGTMMASAHAQDFERRNKNDLLPGGQVSAGAVQDPDDSSEEEEDTGNSTEPSLHGIIDEEHLDEL
ncbi:hypothetical protein ASPZODRAFT_140702 [Penicilliopsis zonata CBS 506.65]|uniref:EXS domain-containing protein n=1 Tax=Penicilliopsis zonata CBS 506.65 TaxID=1073090 RepID=A0A1L9SMS0_9EURO|nr:hypothetical protein ASPZODRAFT_140702 [Penicilliopsis zonata CBS 506.65]OJJ48406.1 hypothetical protein ASPZODRAFT_140702 [Penicilliopsis zonata CBS 506.65]